MKKTILMIAAMCCLTNCEKVDFMDEDTEETENIEVKTKKFTFTMKGDFSDDWRPVTRGYLSADGKDITDLWVLDYMDGQLVQQLHQSDNTAEDFGKPVMQLKYGSHHVYFVASRGVSPVLNTTAHTLTFSTVRDTYWKDYEVSVVATSNGNRAVALDRVVTKLRLVFSDAIPEGAASINVTPATWYYGLDYLTGEPVEVRANETITTNIPTTNIGASGVSMNIYGFSSSTEWTTNLSFNSKKQNGEILSTATINNAPFKRNRVTEYSGPLFGSDGNVTLSLNTDWESSFTGTW